MHIERIKFERTGGFAGIRFAADINMNDLSEAERNKITELLDDVNFKELSEKASGKSPIPDEFVYSLTVKTDEKEYAILSGESALPDQMQPLLDILMQTAKQQMRNKK